MKIMTRGKYRDAHDLRAGASAHWSAVFSEASSWNAVVAKLSFYPLGYRPFFNTGAYLRVTCSLEMNVWLTRGTMILNPCLTLRLAENIPRALRSRLVLGLASTSRIC
jgi:hypothetical protein